MIERLDPIYADFTISQNSLAEVQEQMRANKLKAEVRLPESGPIAGDRATHVPEQRCREHNRNC